jgi:hypothetical protein
MASAQFAWESKKEADSVAPLDHSHADGSPQSMTLDDGS